MTPAEVDHYWMEQALKLASAAEAAGEVPVGAVIVYSEATAETGNSPRPSDRVGSGRNSVIGLNDPSAHAEIRAIRQASGRLKNYRLPDCTLYTTLEPCAMCAGAIVHARLARVVYGAPDIRAGAAGSVFNLLQCAQLNHRCNVQGGVHAQTSRQLLQTFFANRRSSR